MTGGATYLYGLILGCEATFWIVLGSALASRYVLRWERLSRALLFALPIVDLFLLAFTALDLRNGTRATFAHGLATAYVGFTVAFGSLVVRWADAKFAHWLGAGPSCAPAPGALGLLSGAAAEFPSRGWGAVKFDFELWLRCIVAWTITLALLVAVIAFVDDDTITEPLHAWFRIAFGSVFFWFIFGPCWSLVFLRREAR